MDMKEWILKEISHVCSTRPGKRDRGLVGRLWGEKWLQSDRSLTTVTSVSMSFRELTVTSVLHMPWTVLLKMWAKKKFQTFEPHSIYSKRNVFYMWQKYNAWKMNCVDCICVSTLNYCFNLTIFLLCSPSRTGTRRAEMIPLLMFKMFSDSSFSG